MIKIEWDRYAEQNGRVFKTTDEMTAFPVVPSIFSWELTAFHSSRIIDLWKKEAIH